MNETGSTVTTRPDWGTRDPQACERLGEALSKQGYVYYRPKAGAWAVFDPGDGDKYYSVIVHLDYRLDEEWFERLFCTCEEDGPPRQPCVHKAAVYYEVNKPSQYRMYREGY